MRKYVIFLAAGMGVMLMCRIGFCQGQAAQNENSGEPKTFLDANEIPRMPEPISWGFAWPSKKERDQKAFTKSSDERKKEEATIAKCLKASFCEPNSVLTTVTLHTKPGSSDETFSRSAKQGYVIQTRQTDRNVWIGIKRADGKDIWDMSKGHVGFVDWAIHEFFVEANVAPTDMNERFYFHNPEGKEGFWYVYLPVDRRDFSGGYLWTNGKMLVLSINKWFQEDHKTGG